MPTNPTPAAGTQLDGATLYQRQQDLLAARTYPPGPAVVAANLQLPENAGSLIRLADAAGCRQVIFAGTSELDLRRVRRITRHCDEHIPWSISSLDTLLDQMERLRPVIALDITSQSTSVFATTLPAQLTIVIGNERYGIPDVILARCDYAVHIPMYGQNGSMNVTHALGILLFEWRRQQGHY